VAHHDEINFRKD